MKIIRKKQVSRMVSLLLTMIFCVITLFVSLILPVLALIVYGVKKKGKGIWSAWILGAAGFFVMQFLIRIPVLNMLSVQPGFVQFVGEHYVLYCLILGFTAGLFELVGRYAAARIMSKKLTFERALAAGLGHGGIEAILIVGITYINNLICLALIATGSFDVMLEQTAAAGVDVTQLQVLKETFVNTPSIIFLLAGLERLLAMTAHAAMTVIVCYGVKAGRTMRGLLVCLGIHTFMDACSGIVNGMATPYLGSVISQNTAYVIIYVVLAGIAAGAVVCIRKIKGQW